MTLRRGVLWGLLVAALLGVAAAALVQQMHRPEPPPVLGTLPDFALTNRDDRTVHLSDLRGAPWVADFIFTRCPASCPMMTSRMARLRKGLPKSLGTRFVSISVDPEHDTPEVLEQFAKSFEVGEDWFFLTGPRDDVFRLSRDGFKLGVDVPPPDMGAAEPILHSTRFVLVDGEGRIRGYYDAFDEPSVEKLALDLEAVAK